MKKAIVSVIVISVYVLTLSRGALLAGTPYAYPVPCYAGETEEITFVNLDQESDITKYSLSGRLVREIKAGGELFAVWDMLDESSNEAPSGVYIYHIENGNDTEVGKLMLVR